MLKTVNNYRVSTAAHTHTTEKKYRSLDVGVKENSFFGTCIFIFPFLSFHSNSHLSWQYDVTLTHYCIGLMIYSSSRVYIFNFIFLLACVLTLTNWLSGLLILSYCFFCFYNVILSFIHSLIQQRKTCFIRTGVQNPGLNKLLARLVWLLISINKRVTGRAK